MAGFDDFPLAPQQPATQDPWAAFPVDAPAPALAAPAMPPGYDAVYDPTSPMFDPAAPPRAPEAAPAGWTAPNSAVPDERGWGEYLWDTANIAAGSGVRGVANVAGLPVDLINAAPMLANLLPGEQGVGPITDYPIGGSQSLQDLIFGANDAVMGAAEAGLDAAGAPEGMLRYDPKPRDAFQRITSRAAEEIGAAALPGAGLVGAGARMGVQGARNGNWLARTFVEPAAVNPSRFLKTEAALSGGAGYGAGLANELAGNQDRSNPWIDMGGALTGALATGAAGSIGGALRDVAAALSGNERYASEIVRRAVTDDLINNSALLGDRVANQTPSTPVDAEDLIAAITRPSAAEEAIPGFSASTADRAGDAGLAMMEASRARAVPGAYRSRVDANTNAVEGRLGELAPDATPGAFREGLETARGARLDEAAAATASARTDYDEAIAPLQPLMTAEARGADIRAALEGASDKAKEIVAKAWGPVNDASSPVNIGPLRDSFADAADDVPEALAPLMPGASAVPGRLSTPAGPDVPTGVLDASGNPIMRPGEASGEMQPLSEVMGIRSALTNDLRRQGITPQEVRIIEDHIARLDSYLDTALPADMRAAYDAARGATRDYHDRFTRPNTGIGQSLRTTEGGSYAQPDSAVPRKFAQGDQGRLADTEALFKEAGNDPRATGALRDQIMQDARDRGALDSAEAANRFVRENSQLLNRYPDLRDEITRAGSAKAGADAAAKSEAATIAELTKPGKSAVASYLSFGDEKAVSAMNSVMASRDPVKSVDDLLNFVDNAPKAVEGARAAFWKKMDTDVRAKNAAAETDSGTMPIVPRKFAAFLDDPANRAVAERLYRDNPEHLADIIELSEALKGTNIGSRVGNAANPSGTALMMRGQNPVTMAELGSKFYQVQLGRVSPAYVITHLVGKVAGKAVGKQRVKAYEALLDQALLDPKVAKALLQENNPANRAAMARSLRGWRLNEASQIVNMMNEDDEDETVNAVMGGKE